MSEQTHLAFLWGNGDGAEERCMARAIKGIVTCTSEDLCNISHVWCVNFFPVPKLIYPQLRRYFSISQRTTYALYSYFMLQFFLLQKLNHVNTSALQWWRPTERLDKQSTAATAAAAVVRLSELNRCEGWGLSLWISNAHWHRLHPQHATALCNSDGEQLAWQGGHAEGEHSLRAGRQLHPSAFSSHPDQCSCVTSQRHIQRDNNHPLPVPMPTLEFRVPQTSDSACWRYHALQMVSA